MRKEISFSNDEKLAELTIEIADGELSISGTVYDISSGVQSHISSGQCKDECKGVIPEKLSKIWDRWHLNAMKPGTPLQEIAVNHVILPEIGRYDYKEVCEQLRAMDLYEQVVGTRTVIQTNWINGYKEEITEHQKYTYGSKWLKQELPQDVIEYLESLDNQAEFKPVTFSDLLPDLEFKVQPSPRWEDNRIHYSCKLTRNGISITLPFVGGSHYADKEKVTLDLVLGLSIRDAHSALEHDIEGFMDEFGYEYKEAKKTYWACHETLVKLQKLDIDVEDPRLLTLSYNL